MEIEMGIEIYMGKDIENTSKNLKYSRKKVRTYPVRV